MRDRIILPYRTEPITTRDVVQFRLEAFKLARGCGTDKAATFEERTDMAERILEWAKRGLGHANGGRDESL